MNQVADDLAAKKLCACGSDYPFVACCAPYLSGLAHAPTAETLMRSRYTAYTFRKETYLLDTWHSSTRPQHLSLAEPAMAERRWLGLRVIQVSNDSGDSTEATVEFVARYKIDGRAFRQHEISRFVRESNQWFYIDGISPNNE